jgi:hypothetical protein
MRTPSGADWLLGFVCGLSVGVVITAAVWAAS